MKPRLILILTALTGFSVGGLAVRQFFANGSAVIADDVPSPQKNRAGEGRNASTSPKTTSLPPGDKHDFATLVRNSSQILARSSPVGRELERMDVGELKSLLLEIVTTLKAEVPQEDKIAASNLLYSAASEIYRREGLRALEWADGIPKEEGKGTILYQILARVTKDLPETGKQWIDKYREEYGDEWAKGFAHHAVSGANGRGAADILKVLTLFKDDLRGIGLTQGIYAEDFDFHQLVTRQPAGYDFSEAVLYWAARDKEAAWAAVEETIKAGQTRGTTYFGSLFKGIVALEGDEKAAEWMMGKLELVPEGSREKAITAMTRYPLPGETVAKLVRAMPTENDRVLFTAEFATPFRGDSAVEALRALGSEDLQVRALMRSAGRYAGYAANGNPPDQETRDFFTTTMEQLGLSPTSREKVEAELPPAGGAGE